ncbi:MAG: hypothetical protein HN725_04895 [Alphaproteobacteria bacterium]|jgi:hypothetical protein|nr:hypothetical protein [Alphaproteobacteria bacterium]MBT4083697.1 hypothetical protein [Alphaproteobacteria bacterium]MBT4545219.1 hypothetical protein [Alphaproteobacteria bacterium]MBT7744607.1 hypothetical protein [Alphaproteobacteria bacterium]
MEIVEATGHVLEAGKSSELTALLATVADATAMDGEPRFAPKTCHDLARAIVCRKYATGILQLCHLVNAVDACGSGKDRWERFFFGIDKVRGTAIRAWLTQTVTENDWRRPGFELDSTGLHMAYGDGEFALGYGRMPFLTALLETVIAMIGYEPVDQVFSNMTAQATDQEEIKNAANSLNRLIYDWLRDHLPGTQTAEKFEAIVNFLKSNGDKNSVLISDENILKFWQQQNNGHADANGDFRTFRSAVGGFIDFLRAVETGSSQSSVSYARSLGTDREAGEVDPMVLDEDAPAGAWQTPLAQLDSPPADAIKFLNKREREELDFLMDCGPLAIDLPLSVLRSDVFGAVQARITQALRRKEKQKHVLNLLVCDDAESYGQRTERYHDHEQHLLRVQKAVLHALTGDAIDVEEVDTQRDPAGLPEDADTTNVVSLFSSKAMSDDVRQEGEETFKHLNRKGFSDNDLDDPEIMEGFSVGAGALVQARDHLADYLVVLARLQAADEDLEQTFSTDQEVFKTLFTVMYGERK